MPIVVSLLAAVIPILGYLFIIYTMDRYEKEPPWFYGMHVLWGAIPAVLTTLAVVYLLTTLLASIRLPQQKIHSVQSLLFSPIIEEAAKGIFLLFTIRKRWFYTVTDGLVFGGAIGLGFGMTENFFYFAVQGELPSAWLSVFLMRTVFTAGMHCIACGTFGASLGYAKLTSYPPNRFTPLLGFFSAVFIHFAWNYTITESTAVPLAFLFLGASIVLFFVVFAVFFKLEQRIVRSELTEERDNGVIPDDLFESIFRSRKNILQKKEPVLLKTFFQTSAALAFRKHRLRLLSGDSTEREQSSIEDLKAEIENYRKKIFLLSKPFERLSQN